MALDGSPFLSSARFRRSCLQHDSPHDTDSYSQISLHMSGNSIPASLLILYIARSCHDLDLLRATSRSGLSADQAEAREMTMTSIKLTAIDHRSIESYLRPMLHPSIHNQAGGIRIIKRIESFIRCMIFDSHKQRRPDDHHDLWGPPRSTRTCRSL